MSYHSLFSPSSMSLDMLEKTFVQRQELLERVFGIFSRVRLGKSTHNILLVGPRGIGKTHFVSLVFKKLLANHEFLKHGRVV